MQVKNIQNSMRLTSLSKKCYIDTTILKLWWIFKLPIIRSI